jgi:hypothetical protein
MTLMHLEAVTVAKQAVPGKEWARAVGVGLALAILAGCGGGQVSSRPQAAPADPIPLAAKAAAIDYGSIHFTFPVPVSSDQSVIHVTAGDVPGGILWLTPPGFPDAKAQPIKDWSLWFTPASTGGGSLWMGAELWQTFQAKQAPRLLGTNGGCAVIRLAEGEQVQVISVRLTDRRTLTIARHAASAAAGSGPGVYAWQDADRRLHVVNVATGEEQVTVLPGAAKVEPANGGLWVDGKLVSLPGTDPSAEPKAPAGYKWIGTAPNRPEIAVPGNWTVEPIAGGSSAGIRATNPADPNEKVILVDAYCAGCYLPNVTSPQLFDSFSSPLGSGGDETWLDDHTASFTRPADDQSPYPTYGITRTFVERPGIRRAEVSTNNRELAAAILDAMRSSP